MNRISLDLQTAPVLLLLSCLLFTCPIAPVRAQNASVTLVAAGEPCSIRGMSIPSEGVIWVSGSHGRVARSTDTGRTWTWMAVPGYAQTDFRDIHAFDAATAVIMGIGNPAYLLKTRDSGRSWQVVYTREAEGMFLDALDFRNGREGICIGDPLEGKGGQRRFFLLRTRDGGDTWQEEAAERCPEAAPGEAVFSASGTNIALLDGADFDYAFISGGLRSNLYLAGRGGRPGKVYPLPLHQGNETAGAFSMATDGRKMFYCAGGDYKLPDSVTGSFAWTADGGRSWQTPRRRPPGGYRSCVRIIGNEQLVACGTNGVDLCRSANKWRQVSPEGFNVCAVSPGRKLVFFGGEKGKIGVLRL